MSFAGALAFAAVAALLLRSFRAVDRGLEVARLSRQVLDVLADAELDDDAKGARLRAHARRLFALFAVLLACGVGAVLVPLGALCALDAAGLISAGGVLGWLTWWPFLCAAALGPIALQRTLRPVVS